LGWNQWVSKTNGSLGEKPKKSILSNDSLISTDIDYILTEGIFVILGFVYDGFTGAVNGYINAKILEYYNGPMRDALNNAYFSEHAFNPADTSDFKQFSDSESAFHQIHGEKVGKFETLIPDKRGGYPEVVWNYTKEEVVSSPKEKGTYNYGHGFISHGIKDVLPWILLGTGKDDPSSMKDRAFDFISAIPNYYRGMKNEE